WLRPLPQELHVCSSNRIPMCCLAAEWRGQGHDMALTTVVRACSVSGSCLEGVVIDAARAGCSAVCAATTLAEPRDFWPRLLAASRRQRGLAGPQTDARPCSAPSRPECPLGLPADKKWLLQRRGKDTGTGPSPLEALRGHCPRPFIPAGWV